MRCTPRSRGRAACHRPPRDALRTFRPRPSSTSRMLLPVHIVAGGLAIVLGAIALAASKGLALHRRSGLLFVYAMVAMGTSGSVLALRQSLTNANVLGGI